MRRVREVVTVMGTCALLAAAPGSAQAWGVSQAETVHVGVQLTQGPSSAMLSPDGRLPDNPGPHNDGLENDAADFGMIGTGTVIGGDTLATIGLASRSKPIAELLLYTKGAAGWSHATGPALYSFPPNFSVFSIAAADGLVAVNGQDPGGVPISSTTCTTPVFTAGSGGFTSTLTPAACLPANVEPVVAKPRMVVATDGPSTLDVFTEPAGGWTGRVARSAQLQASNGDDLVSVSLSGSTVAAVGQGGDVVHLFTQPTGGWSGLVHDSAQIRIPGGARVATVSDGKLVALGTARVVDSAELVARAAVFVLRRPRGGWRSTPATQPRAYIQTGPGQDSNFGLEPASPFGAMTAFTNVVGCASQGYPPCSTGIWAVNGLDAKVAAPAQLPVGPSTTESADGTPLASDGTTLALGANGVQFYTVAHTAPARVDRATLTGLTAGRGNPVLRLRVTAGRGAAAVVSLRVLVPVRLGGRGVPRMIALKPARRAATVTLRRLSASAGLRRAVRHIETLGGRAGLTVTVELFDAAGRSSESKVQLTISR